MNEIRYIVSWHFPGNMGVKTYKSRDAAFAFAFKLKYYETGVVMVDKEEQANDKWVLKGRWLY